MKDATITQDGQPISQERFPSVVTTDDLIFELGRKEVDRLNKEKLLEGLLGKKRQAESQIVDAEKVKSEAKKQVAILEDSNKRYEENNRNLSDELVKVKQDLTNEIDKNAQLVKQYEGQLKQLSLNLEEARKPKKKSPRKKRM